MYMSEAENIMEQEPKRKYRLILDFKSQFPEKLFDVANDGYLIQWNRDDTVSVRNDDEFEQNVMRLYPGFLQIPSILNLKRLFREYGFERDIGPNGILKFSHPSFQRGRRQLLFDIKTRRKSYRTPQYWRPSNFDESLVIDAEEGKRYSTRKRRRTYHFNESPANPACLTPGKTDIGGCGDFGENSPTVYCIPRTVRKSSSNLVNGPSDIQSTQAAHDVNTANEHLNKPDLHKMMGKFASYEFNEQEYNEWLDKQRKMDEAKTVKEELKTPEGSKNFWWMYGERPGDANNSSKQHSAEQENCMPCGFCKCCSAISNYVHIFGEVPENIQVYDFVEEVFEAEEQESNNVVILQT